ncbi:4-phosphopantetheinyl transferase [Streptomyces armeniacus]|uniref:4-phosphopantetheinyl transferase n=1 Tax=Streptomyces armeniacus TaxID=83291 RepID=A0A345XJL5_9ACTN|nr:4'-phosphopantetheinyl transferase superfamily protein [Streptomyces armeniacus]AXK31831.1 4-phosphopantetheinyl transferase [Streptomyces armeniacus]
MSAAPAPLVHAPGPGGPWHSVRDSLRHHGLAVAYGWAAAWVPPGTAQRERELPDGGPDGARRPPPPRVRERRSAARFFFRHTVARALGTSPAYVDLAYMPHGRPYVRGCDGLEVSLSHSGPLLAVALSTRGRVGVDVEAADRPLGGAGWERRVCTPRERAVLAAVPGERRTAELVRMWTLKEAYSKALGQGMRYAFDRLGFPSDGPPERSLGPEGHWQPVTGWHCATALPESAPAYRVSWVYQRRPDAAASASGWADADVAAFLAGPGQNDGAVEGALRSPR